METGIDRRTILEEVAAGKLTPQEASDALGRLEGEPANTVTTMSSEPKHHTDVRSVRVVGRFRALKINGDLSLTGVSIEGPHSAHTKDGVMTIEDEDTEEQGFVLFGGQSGRKSFRWKNDQPPALRITMNPMLALEVDITAGTVKVHDIHSPIKANITAGSGRFEGVRGPIQAGVEAGSLFISGRFLEGDSEVRCSAGKVRVGLSVDSSVSVKARATLGKIQIPSQDGQDQHWSGMGMSERGFKLGDGLASLDIETTTGSI
ncbi:MAG: hypothetical protein ABIS18_05920, partial [Actinomycetota bacterium]